MKKKTATKRSKATTTGNVAFALKHATPKKKVASKKRSIAKKTSGIYMNSSAINEKIVGIPITDIVDRQPRQNVPDHRQPRAKPRKRRKPSRK